MDISIRRGDDETLTVTITDAVDLPVDLTGATVRFTAKRSAKDPDDRAVLSRSTGSGINAPSPTNGVAVITIPKALTALLDPGTYDYDVQVTTAAGVTSTVVAGLLRVSADVTIAAP